MGSDRYTRSYWLLPSAGGIFVEGADTSSRRDGSVKKPQRLSVIEDKADVVSPDRKRKLSVKNETSGDDVFEAPVVKKVKEEDEEAESDVDTMNLSLLSDVCQQAKELNSQDEANSSHTQTPATSPSPPPPACDEEPMPIWSWYPCTKHRQHDITANQKLCHHWQL